MYIFAKFVPDHIFLQNREKLNKKKKFRGADCRGTGTGERVKRRGRKSRSQEQRDALPCPPRLLFPLLCQV
jgi:hypothetical protein